MMPQASAAKTVPVAVPTPSQLKPRMRKQRRKEAGASRTGAGLKTKPKSKLKPKRRNRLGRPLSRRRQHRRTGHPQQPLPVREPNGSTEQQAAEAYARGLNDGRYEGGEYLLEQAAPPGLLLAGVELRHAIALGVEALRSTLIPIVDVGTVWQELEAALQQGQPYAVVRLGDGELLALAHDLVLDAAAIQREAPFLSYAGIDVPDHAARDRLAEAVRHANMVGVPTSRRPFYQPLLIPALNSHGIDIRSIRVTDSTINYSLYQAGLLRRLLEGRRILAIGNEAYGMAEKLRAMGLHVTGVITPIQGFGDIDRAVEEARACEFDIALVSAGIPAVVIAVRIATEMGKVALDFGHMADQIVKGQVLL